MLQRQCRCYNGVTTVLQRCYNGVTTTRCYNTRAVQVLQRCYNAVFALLIPCDTSECERVFSLMNDLKTAERNRLGQANLTHLMIWHLCSKDRSCAELDVRPILDEFMRLAGTKGRKTHRGMNPPEYTYGVGKCTHTHRN